MRRGGRRAGAPLRFLGVVLGGWAAARAVLLWPTVADEVGASTGRPPTAARGVGGELWRAPPLTPSFAAIAWPKMMNGAVIARTPWAPPHLSLAARMPVPIAVAPEASLEAMRPQDESNVTIALASFVHYGDAAPPDRPAPSPSRLSASAWAIARPAGRNGGAAITPQLGGSQGGARFAYALDDARRLAATLRVAGAVGEPDREIAPGVEWRLPHVPIRFFAEQRVALARGRGGTTIGAIAGISRALPARLDLEGYAQGGVIARGGGEGFVDAAARVSRPFVAGGVALDLGLGSWGAAQRGAARLDAGPTLGATLPVGGGHVRLAADWRQRLAGNARPASGPALSLGADF